MPLRALLFDLDGTLSDSDTLHFHAFQTVARDWGADFDRAYFDTSMSGHSNGEICRTLFPALGAAEHDRIAAEKETLFRASLDRLQPVPGLGEVLDWASGRGLRLAVVSNAPRANVDGTLRALGIAGYFAVTVSAEELPRGKPDPLPYRTALEQLDITADQAVAFEDAVPGLTAAVGAALPTVGVRTTQPPGVLERAGAVLTVRDFSDPALMPFLNGRF
jgi:HAD superfamily hydrolase (TIGR01509 family)